MTTICYRITSATGTHIIVERVDSEPLKHAGNRIKELIVGATRVHADITGDDGITLGVSLRA